MIDYSDYLTEQNLGLYLTKIFNVDWVHDKAFITRQRPDYRNDQLKTIVEFDGPQHYTSPNRIISDARRDTMYQTQGYATIRIPYFIQLSKEIIKMLFNVNTDVNQTYPHGFISDKKTLVLPAEFCELGIERFKEDLIKFDCIKFEIVESLKTKIDKLGDQRLVIPKSLEYLVK